MMIMDMLNVVMVAYIALKSGGVDCGDWLWRFLVDVVAVECSPPPLVVVIVVVVVD